MTIHGVSKEIVETGKIAINNGKVNGAATFKIAVADYNIKIPKIMRQNIAKVVEVNVKLDLKKK
jgi:YceI-like domain.